MTSIIKSSYARIVHNNPVILNPYSLNTICESGDMNPNGDQLRQNEASALEAEARVRAEEEYKEAYAELIAAAEDEVSMMLADARKRSAEIISEAKSEAEKIKEQSREEGYNIGYAEAAEKFRSLFDEAQKKLDETMEEAYEKRNAIIDGAEQDILRLSVKIAEKILNNELKNNDAAYKAMITRAIGEMKPESRVEIRVNPAEYVRHFKSRETTFLTQNGRVPAVIINDSTVEEGGCLIEAESGTVDAGAASQLGQIVRGLGLDNV